MSDSPATPDALERADAYRFELPDDLIAQAPAARRDESRLLVLEGERGEDRIFRDLPELLQPGDLLVLNDTRVIAARVHGTRDPSGGAVELLLLHPADASRYDANATVWNALAKPARRLAPGARIAFGELGSAEVVRAYDDGLRDVRFDLHVPFETFLGRAGTLPLPPYIHNDSADAQERYQTVFARVPGSVAAPTASLHFTEEVLARIRERGVEIAYVTLDVGLGTFRPMTAERLDEHRMHAETYDVPEATAAAIETARAQGRRVIAAGTTVVRTLEGCAQAHGRVVAGEGSTDLFIRPGFAFRIVDAMITNFHLPQSTLLVLVCTFAGRERVLHAYRDAVARRYRFFSFGDAMFVTRERARLHDAATGY
ncbi:MAG: tRNA preQ1(34) S-adenosylmethionine ribosyltransferase-isomerase QueA [bacterium]|nr:tRNA preQ1(34) S-adenosylmethionine ribosyltransferase-isomerase QueA [bacterium]